MERIGDMPLLLLFVFRFVRLLLSGHQAVALENAALRMQIAAFQRKGKRPLLSTLDRVFWISLRILWDDWRKPLLYISQTPWCDGSASGSGDLGQVVQAAAPGPRSPPHRRRTPPIDRTNGRRQSAVARTQNSWRTQDARYRHLERTVSGLL